MRVSRSNESFQIKVNNRELKVVGHFKYLGSVLKRDGYCTGEMKMRTAMAKETYNRIISFLTSKLNRCYISYISSMMLYDSEIWTLRNLELKYL